MIRLERFPPTSLQQQFPQKAIHIVHHYPDYWTIQGKPVLVGTLSEPATPPYVSQTISAHDYACFALPEAAGITFLTDYIYQTWLPQSDYKLAAPFELEIGQQLFIPIELDR